MDENIIKSAHAFPFLTNPRIDMASFVDFHKVIVKRNAFLAFSSARNGGESKGVVENGRLKHQFHK
jgi:hypothetical protein